ncbi:Uncharacterised protein [Vibrio cholerae]|nr:Uncharacterised protein [Vibrio cholerae]
MMICLRSFSSSICFCLIAIASFICVVLLSRNLAISYCSSF